MVVRADKQADKQADNADDDERALVRRIGRGERAAISRLYCIYHPRLFKFLYRLTNSYTASDELVNDIMLVVWRKAAEFRGDSRVSTWIFGIAYRQAMRRIRRRKLFRWSVEDPDELAATGDRDLESEDLVRYGLDSLPAAQKVTMMLVFYQGLSYAEVAEVTECPVNTVKTRMYHARRTLRARLRKLAAPADRKDDSEND